MVRVTSPSRSRSRKVSVSMRWEMALIVRRISLKRIGPPSSSSTTSTVHLSPMRAKSSLTAVHGLVSCVSVGIKEVPPAQKLACHSKKCLLVAAARSIHPSVSYELCPGNQFSLLTEVASHVPDPARHLEP